jgi:hypothetical protein
LARVAEALKMRPAVPRAAQARAKAELPALDPPIFMPRQAELRVPEPRMPEPRTPEHRGPEPRIPEPRGLEARMPEPRAAEPVQPAPAASTVEVSATAIERLRSSMARPDRSVPEAEEVPLSPNGSHHAAERAPEPGPAEPAARFNPAAAESKEARLDFLFRSKSTPRPSQPQQFEALWPRRQRGALAPSRSEDPARAAPGSVAERPAVAEAPPAAAAERRAMPEPAPAEDEARSVAILKSGVVDGMAYTLYADGSIEAQLPHGTVRFGSIAELRAHIENSA